MKTILFAALALFAVPALAQCELKWSFAAEGEGKKATNVRTLTGMSAAELAAHQKRGMHVLDSVSKDQDKGGAYTVTLLDSSTCDGKPTPNTGTAIELRGLTLHSVTKFLRAAAKDDAQMHDDLDKRHAAKKKAWGD